MHQLYAASRRERIQRGKPPMMTFKRELNSLEAEAVAWLARCDRGLDDKQADEFARWLDADPQHAATMHRIEGEWSAFNLPAEPREVDSFRAELQAMQQRDRRRWRNYGAAAAVAAACVAIYLTAPFTTRPGNTVVAQAASTVHVLAPERQILPDGSIVELKPGAEIAVAFDAARRVVVLKQGEAHFSVTKNPARPFVVEAGSVKVRAVGTAFAVQLGGENVEVLVTEGRVSVASTLGEGAAASGRNPEPDVSGDIGPLVDAGQQALVSLSPSALPASVVTLSAEELNERLAWRVPLLDFAGTTLTEAVAMFNRHGKTQLRVADKEVAELRITGVFRSDNPEGFVRAAEVSLGLRAEHGPNEILLQRTR